MFYQYIPYRTAIYNTHIYICRHTCTYIYLYSHNIYIYTHITNMYLPYMHTQRYLEMSESRCGAINGAAKTYMESTSTEPGSALEGLLLDLARVAQKASEELGPCSEKQLAQHAVKACGEEVYIYVSICTYTYI